MLVINPLLLLRSARHADITRPASNRAIDPPWLPRARMITIDIRRYCQSVQWADRAIVDGEMDRARATW